MSVILAQYLGGGGSPVWIYAGISWAAIFDIAAPAVITEVQVYGVRRSVSTGVGTAEIWSADSETGAPVEQLASATYDGSVWTSPSVARNISLPTPLPVVAGKYALVVTNPAALEPNGIYWDAEVLGVGENSGHYSLDGMSSWIDSVLQFPRYVILGSGLSKPTNPTPTSGTDPGTDWSDWTVSWVDGGGAETYDVFIGSTPYSLNRYAEGIADTSHTFAAGQRPVVTDTIVYWRVDAIAGEERVTGDVWSFDPRPAKATTPSPADTATGQSLYATPISWASGSANTATYDVYFGETLIALVVDDSDTSATIPTPLRHNHEYHWRVDSRNSFGTTEGDEWTFTTSVLVPPTCSYTILPGMTLGPLDGGVEGIDFIWNGSNNMRTSRWLIAAARNRIWYGGNT
jgi:hypothetical protein